MKTSLKSSKSCPSMFLSISKNSMTRANARTIQYLTQGMLSSASMVAMVFKEMQAGRRRISEILIINMDLPIFLQVDCTINLNKSYMYFLHYNFLHLLFLVPNSVFYPLLDTRKVQRDCSTCNHFTAATYYSGSVMPAGVNYFF